jgi:hypothetical protein
MKNFSGLAQSAALRFSQADRREFIEEVEMNARLEQMLRS